MLKRNSTPTRHSFLLPLHNSDSGLLWGGVGGIPLNVVVNGLKTGPLLRACAAGKKEAEKVCAVAMWGTAQNSIYTVYPPALSLHTPFASQKVRKKSVKYLPEQVE